MSIEFAADTDDASSGRVAILNALAGNINYQLLGSPEPNRVLIRLTKNPIRNMWPEDVALLFSEEKIEIVFHSTDRADRELFLRFVEAILEALGRPSKFVEQ
jgi:hypothetical protein